MFLVIWLKLIEKCEILKAMTQRRKQAMETIEKEKKEILDSTYTIDEHFTKRQSERRAMAKKVMLIQRVIALVFILVIVILSGMLVHANSQLRQQKELVLQQQTKNEELTKKITDLENTIKDFEEKEKLRTSSNAQIPSNRPKTVYLTFDDGPGPGTPDLLKVLKEMDTKVTFFVTGTQAEKYPDLVKQMSDEGHEVGLHSYSHKYQQIYASKEAFFQDFDKVEELVKKCTGKQPKLLRFPGGSNNGVLNSAVRKEIIEELINRGYGYTDWNALTRDAEGKKLDDATLTANTVKTIGSQSHPIVLAHDSGGNSTSANAVKSIISTMKEKGYAFDKLTNTSPDLVHYAK